MATTAERMLINAAIEKLLAQSDESYEAARVVIDYGQRLKSASATQLEIASRAHDSHEHTSGYSPGIGEINLEHDTPTEQREYTFGISRDRVGYYRLWKQKEGQICFQHYWKSDANTNPGDDTSDIYYLGYCTKKLEPKYFGIFRERVAFRLWIGHTIEFTRHYLEPIFGEMPKLTTIGIRGG
ncbi:MAG TPA: hypothetical protein VLB83_05140 [Candidatus Paceibacterota bacterium]|nr:hypothetical protein [Candidatus Paceibacterota bacterium]